MREGGGPSVMRPKPSAGMVILRAIPLYRAEGEVQRLREQRDPLKIFTAKVKQHITEELAAIDEEVEAGQRCRIEGPRRCLRLRKTC